MNPTHVSNHFPLTSHVWDKRLTATLFNAITTAKNEYQLLYSLQLQKQGDRQKVSHDSEFYWRIRFISIGCRQTKTKVTKTANQSVENYTRAQS